MSCATQPRLTRRLTLSEKVFAGVITTVPTISAIFFLFNIKKFNITSFDIALFIAFYIFTGFGISLGYHRFLAHKSFKTNRIIKILIVSLGCMTFEGGPFFWVAAHRRHHQHQDVVGDPHSPHQSKSKIYGFFHSHFLWFFTHTVENWTFYIKDLLLDSDLRNINKNWLWIALFGLILPGIISGIYYGTWPGFAVGILFAGLVRIAFVQHITWSVNSICHLFGFRTYQTTDHSKNNILFAFLGLGEGWHNNHHAFPYSARHGLKWWQFDLSYLAIRIMEQLKLVWDLHLPLHHKLKEDFQNKASNI